MNEKRRRFEAQALPHLDAAYNLARWLARPPLDADDIVQDAMLRAYRAFDSFRGDNVRPWLLAIVRNCFLTAAGRTRSAHDVPLPSDPEIGANDLALISADPDPEAAAILADDCRRLAACIVGLPEEFREVLLLREMEDLSYREIARITAAPIGTVMSRLARARAMLKEKMQVDGKGVRHAVQ